jgi:hypothetical protein
MGWLDSGGGGGSDLDAGDFIDDGTNEIRFVLLVAGIWIEAMATVVSIHVWIIDNIGEFFATVVETTLGVGATAQIAAWETAAKTSLGTPFAMTFVLVLEAFVLYLVINGARERGVLP